MQQTTHTKALHSFSLISPRILTPLMIPQALSHEKCDFERVTVLLVIYAQPILTPTLTLSMLLFPGEFYKCTSHFADDWLLLPRYGIAVGHISACARGDVTFSKLLHSRSKMVPRFRAAESRGPSCSGSACNPPPHQARSLISEG